jgi:hypothetical protein
VRLSAGATARSRTLCKLALALALVVSLLLPTAARAAEPGVVSDLSWAISDADKQRQVPLLQEIGSDWVRLNVQWKDAEQSKGSYDAWWFREYDRAVQAALDANQEIVMAVYNAPDWGAVLADGGEGQTPADPAEFAGFMRYLAERYRGKVAAYEIWNEPNALRFWNTGPNAIAYTELLKAAYPVIKEADPDAEVVFGGLALNDYDFVQAAYDAGARGYFDVMATHPYTGCVSRPPEHIRYATDGRMTKNSFLAYREVRATMLAYEDDKPIWLTEFGWNTSTAICGNGQPGGVTELEQADYLIRAFQLVEEDPYVPVALWYNFRNNYWQKDDPNSREAQFGLVRTDFSPKAAYYALRDYASGNVVPGTVKAYQPAGYTLVSGSVYSGRGDISRLYQNDGSRVEISSAKSGRTQVAEIQPYASITPEERASLSRLVVEYDGNASSHSAAITLLMRNFQTGQWVTLDGPRTGITSDRPYTWWNSTNPRDYVSGTGEVRFSVRGTRSSSFRTATDLVRFTITY